MELSRTINSDKRYYLDENTIENAASFLQTMRVFNDAKIDLYNALYDPVSYTHLTLPTSSQV